jgi:hypothetical protein
MSGYMTQSSDTSLEAERWLIERYRAMTPAQKIHMFRELSRASQELALAGIRERHPDAGDDELRMRVASTRLPASIMSTVFGWDGTAHTPR